MRSLFIIRHSILKETLGIMYLMKNKKIFVDFLALAL